MYSRLKAEAEINLPLQAARVTIRQIVTMHPYAGSQVQSLAPILDKEYYYDIMNLK